MKALAAALTALTLAVSALAEDALLQGGLAPNGRFEVRITRVGERGYDIGIHARGAKRPFYTLKDVGRFDRYAEQVQLGTERESSHAIEPRF